jgi:hypothetical protein
MAKNKAELQRDYDQHRALMVKAKASIDAGLYQEATSFARSALEYVDGMMQYDRKYGTGKELNSIDSIDMVVEFAPCFLGSKNY